MEENSKLLEIYTHTEEDISYKGYLRYEDEYGAVFEIIDDLGRYDYLLWLKDGEIEFMDSGTEELKKYEYFVEYSKKKAIYEPHDLKMIDVNEEEYILNDILLNIYWSDQMITLESKEYEGLDTGYIRDIKEDSIVLTGIDICTCEVVEDVTYKISDILSIEFNSVENQLYRYANNMVSKGTIEV